MINRAIILALSVLNLWMSQTSDTMTCTKLHQCQDGCYLVSGTRKFDRGLSRLLHVDLHWLDVPERVQYKLGVTVRRCQQHKAPQYLIYCVTPASDIARHRLRTLCQSSPTSCAALPTQLTWSSVLRCCWTDDLEFAVG